MDKFYYSVDQNAILQNTTLIWPALTIGNVGQLSVDLLISTLKCKRIGYIIDENIIPIIGNDTYTPNGSGVLSTSIEVYQPQDNKSNITIVQQRAPILEGHVQIFANKLIEWYKKENFRELLFISSTNANKRIDSQLVGDQVRFVKSNGLKNESLNRILQCNIKETESNVMVDSYGDTVQLGNRLTGLGKELWKISNEQSLSYLCLNLFCSEGDNTLDSMDMAKYISSYLNLFDSSKPIDFVIPNSWSLLQGPTYDQALYF
ncbi:proteasome assembly chaperone 2 [Tieghemostelium lacteum]|uniref:Proteasome assembly chaperone 2 n=1 Tax=Tieghemostelium lacteum TaxID=361077 RepID=A0A151ZKB9_TIELA|nr:proteasome assembly chaperone 2 [Tieghemostelium lacteum]|eukprot:KYQ94264.1 proteasome assembly chaperone 2 [Tieghemostelium lacteum]